MIDPGPDPAFPNRPDHEDFRCLSRAAQKIDEGAEDKYVLFENIVPLDMASLDYYIEQRLGIHSVRLGVDLNKNSLIKALYLEAVAVGTLAEQIRGEE